MKHTLFLFLMLAAMCYTVSACGANHNGSGSGSDDKISIVEGEWNRASNGEIKLYEVVNGKLKKVASSMLNSEKKFYFAFKVPAEAYYVVGMNDVAGQSNNYTFYFKPGDRLNVIVGDESYELTGANTPENVELTRWHDWIQPLERRSIYSRSETGFSSYEDFFPALTEKLAEGYTPAKTSNRVFDEGFEFYRDANLTSVAMNMLVTPRTKHPSAEDMTDYYKNLSLEKIADSRLLGFPYGMDILRSFPLVYGTIHKDADMGSGLNASIDFMSERIGDEQLKAEYLLTQAARIKTYEGYLDFEKKYGENLITQEQKDTFRNLLKNIPIPEAAPAVDFKFSDTDGNMVSLSDFKGKVVYIDVWATWCGPCKAQIPALKKLEAEFHGNPDLVFMSVSTDKESDRQKWLDMVKSEDLGGVQLFAGDKATDIMGPYKIKGIPRFILVGKDGKLVNIDAPRPSSSEIRPLLNSVLKK